MKEFLLGLLVLGSFSVYSQVGQLGVNVKAENIISSDINDGESFFDPSNDKIYRHPTFYKITDGVKHS